jgi:acyl carrier protein
MDAEAIRTQIKSSIATVTGMDPTEVGDSASYRDDLGLDSLSILEIAIDVEYHCKIKVPDEEMSKIRTIGDTIQVIQRYLGLSGAEVCQGESLSPA